MAGGQTIAITCNQCKTKIRCTPEAWTKGFPCSNCNALVQRPPVTKTPSPTTPDQLSNPVAQGQVLDDIMLGPSGDGVGTPPVKPVKLHAKAAPEPEPPEPAPEAPATSMPEPAPAAPATAPKTPTAAPKPPMASLETAGQPGSGGDGNDLAAERDRALKKAAEAQAIAKKLKQQYDTLKAEVDHLANDRAAAEAEAASASEKVDLAEQKAQVEMKVLKDQLKQYMNLKVELTKQIQEQQQKAENESKRAATLEREKNEIAEKAKAKLDEVKAKANEVVKKKVEQVSSQYREQFTQFKEKHNKLGTELKAARERAKAVEDKEAALKEKSVALEVKAEESEALKGKCEAAEKERQEAEEKVDALESELEKLKVETSQLHVRVENAADAEELADLQTQNEMLKDHLIKARAELAEQVDQAPDQEAVKAAENAREEAKKQVAKLQDRCEQLQNEKDELNEKLAAANRGETADATGDAAELQATCEKLEREKIQLQEQLENQKQRADGDDAGALEKLNIQNRLLKDKVVNLNDELHQTREDLEIAAKKAAEQSKAAGPDPETVETLERATVENEILKSKVLDLTDRLQQADGAEGKTAGDVDPTEVATLKADKQKLESELKDLKKRTAEAIASKEGEPEVLAALGEANEELKAEVAKLKKQLDQAEAAPAAAGTAELDDDEVAQRVRVLEEQLHLLEQENTRLNLELNHTRQAEGEDLGENGVLQLEEIKPDIGKDMQELLSDGLAGEPIVFAAESNEKVSTGRAFGKTRAWVFLTPTSLHILAPGKKPLKQRIPRDKLHKSFWNKLTNKLVLMPSVPNCPLPSLSLAGDEGNQLLEYLQAPAIRVHRAEPPKKIKTAAQAAPAARPAETDADDADEGADADDSESAGRKVRNKVATKKRGSLRRRRKSR